MPLLHSDSVGSWKIFLVFLRLGLTSFGGPVAHLGYFHQEFVVRRRWLSERSYAELVTLCQFLPGPASSQVGIALGLSQAGYRGALAAWCGFTLPSALLLILLALGLNDYGDALPMGILHGLKVVAVAIVAQAVWNMARVLCPDLPRIALMLLAASAVLLVSSAWVQLTVIVAAGVAGLLLFKPAQAQAHEPLPIALSRRTGALWLGLFVALLLGLPLLADRLADPTLGMLDAFYRTGALVFGGGHVMLPLLQAEVVPNGWVDNQTFLAGYGATQAMPGPLFTFAAFLGASMHGPQTSWLGGLLALLAIFAPAFLLVFGALPFWEQLRGNRHMQAALLGINAAVVGLLLAALYRPVWSSAIFNVADFALAALALLALMRGRVPPWAVVLACGLAGWLLSVML